MKLYADDERRKTGYALLVTAWYSTLAPLSWFVVFKAHAYIHTSLDFLVWQMPFMFFGLALSGYAIQYLYAIKVRRSALE
ncbi:MAG: hypothetical protein HN560_03500 [Anaerolineae bacterium]|jgi:hypothetical protein|nr:hypothetical protein [Anaerolineae bacterium]MBT7600120.1 hypothetical protein [Anaerolineae bacterium]